LRLAANVGVVMAGRDRRDLAIDLFS